MRVRVMIEVSRDEIAQKIPYALICTTRESGIWNTARRRRRWAEEFTEAEKAAAYKLFKLAHSWYLVKGVPDEITMSTSTFRLWQRLGEFCASL